MFSPAMAESGCPLLGSSSRLALLHLKSAVSQTNNSVRHFKTSAAYLRLPHVSPSEKSVESRSDAEIFPCGQITVREPSQ